MTHRGCKPWAGRAVGRDPIHKAGSCWVYETDREESFYVENRANGASYAGDLKGVARFIARQQKCPVDGKEGVY